jgi:hypothetical protein
LGIDLAACQKRRVNTGAGTTHHYEWGEPLVATVEGHTIELCASFGPVLVGLLGRDDFFECFRVEFDHRRKITLLHPYLGAD